MREIICLTVASGLLLFLALVVFYDLSKFPKTPHHMRTCSISVEALDHTMYKCGKASR
jgi:hypothetical protein